MDLYTVEQEGTYTNENGDPFYFPAGHKLPHSLANQFPTFVTPGAEIYIPGLTNVRPLGSATYDEAVYSEDE